jgi:HAMP domain-containing protein
VTTVIIVVVVAMLAAVIAARLLRRRQDPVDSFRRQIDALSPEARRPTIDQVRDAAEDPGTGRDEDA